MTQITMLANVFFILAAVCLIGCAASARVIEVPVGQAIQAAIDEVASHPGGGTVILKAGVHEIDQPLRMKSHVTLRGEGELHTTLKTAANIKIITAEDSGLTNLGIHNLRIVGSNALRGGGIHLVAYKQDHTHITVSDVHVLETGWGVHIKGAKQVVIENCHFLRNGTADRVGYAHNLYLRRCDGVTVRDSKLNHSISANGINISYSSNIRIIRCEAIGNHFRGMRAADSDSFLVHNCVIANNGTVGLLANTEKRVTKNIDWQNNHVFDNGAEGIYAHRNATGICKNNNAYGNQKGNYRLPETVTQIGNVSTSEERKN